MASLFLCSTNRNNRIQTEHSLLVLKLEANTWIDFSLQSKTLGFCKSYETVTLALEGNV